MTRSLYILNGFFFKSPSNIVLTNLIHELAFSFQVVKQISMPPLSAVGSGESWKGHDLFLIGLLWSQLVSQAPHPASCNEQPC